MFAVKKLQQIDMSPYVGDNQIKWRERYHVKKICCYEF